MHSPAAIALQSHRRGVYTSGRDRARPPRTVDRQARSTVSEDVPASLFNRADRVHAGNLEPNPLPLAQPVLEVLCLWREHPPYRSDDDWICASPLSLPKTPPDLGKAAVRCYVTMLLLHSGYPTTAGATWMLLILWLLDGDDVFGRHSPTDRHGLVHPGPQPGERGMARGTM